MSGGCPATITELLHVDAFGVSFPFSNKACRGATRDTYARRLQRQTRADQVPARPTA